MKLWEAYEKLDYTEKTVLSQRIGFCPECFSIFCLDYNDLDKDNDPKMKRINPMMSTDIATTHEYSSSTTAKNIYNRAVKKLREAVKEFV